MTVSSLGLTIAMTKMGTTVLTNGDAFVVCMFGGHRWRVRRCTSLLVRVRNMEQHPRLQLR